MLLGVVDLFLDVPRMSRLGHLMSVKLRGPVCFFALELEA